MQTPHPSLKDRFTGSLLGLAVGDALGSHFEGQSSQWILRRYASPDQLLDDLPACPWYYTDDTQMAIGIAEALLADGEIVEKSLCEAFVSNYDPHRGYGHGARVVLGAMKEGQDYKYWAHELFPGGSFGNGAAMRVAPVGLFFHHDVDRVWEQARLASLPTHVHPLGIEGAQLVALAVAMCVGAKALDRKTYFGELQRRSAAPEFQSKLALAEQAGGREDLSRLGNGIAAQESAVTAIACFTLWPDSYEQVVANAILLGGDTDTIAAMAGAISGAYLGQGGIPARLIDCVEDGHKGRTYIRELAERLASE